MATVLTKEVELARRLAPLKRELLLCADYSVEAAFRTVDKSDTGAVTTVNLGAFFREHGYSASETELLAIVRRLDTDGDAAIRYKEWQLFFPEAVPEPIPEPELPPPVYYYSRYYDWLDWQPSYYYGGYNADWWNCNWTYGSPYGYRSYMLDR